MISIISKYVSHVKIIKSHRCSREQIENMTIKLIEEINDLQRIMEKTYNISSSHLSLEIKDEYIQLIKIKQILLG